MDVRGTLRTDDGALILTQYHGVIVAPPEVWEAFGRQEPVDPKTYYFRTAPRYETGDERYSWLNTSVSVAVGAVIPGGVSYRVYRVV